MSNVAGFAGALVAIVGLVVGISTLELQSLSAASVATPGSYESSDPAISYSGTWTVNDAAASASGGEVHYSATAGSYVTLEFEGDAVTLITAKGPAEGMATMTIDGTTVQEIDLYHSGAKQWQVPIRHTALPAGHHILKIALHGTKNILSTGYDVVIDGFVVEGPAATATPTTSSTPVPTVSSTPTITPTPTATSTASSSATPTLTPTYTPTGVPSATVTPTATSAPAGQVRVEAHVDFQRPIGAAPSSRQEQVTMWVYSAGGWNAGRQGVLATTSATTSADGVGLFTLDGIAPGSYDLQLKGTHTLSRLVSGVSLAAGTNVVQFGTLSEGDANGDDQVDAADFQFVAGRFGLRSGESGFDTAADLTGDGVVDVADLSLLAGNYGARGPAQ